MDDMWHPGHIYKAWEEINHALLEVMKRFPRQTLEFLVNRASDGIVRAQAAHVLDWLENRHSLPDWGWAYGLDGACLRCPREEAHGISGA